METSLLKYFIGDQPDLISVTALEQFRLRHPSDIISKLLLAKKMKQNDDQELMLYFNDRTAYHYLSSDSPIPSIRDLQVKEEERMIQHQITVDTIFLNRMSEGIWDDHGNTLSVDLQTEETAARHEDENATILHEDENVVILQDNVSNETEIEAFDSEINTDINPQIGEGQHLSEGIQERSDDTSDDRREQSPGENVPLSEHQVKDQDVLEEKEAESITEIKAIKKKKSKKKKNKYILKEFSGISPYTKWLLTFKNSNLEKIIQKEEKVAKRKAIEASAHKSIEKSSAIISEPLADLLAAQGHYDDAKKMYEQLMLKYPEKSSYFAAKIIQNIK